MRTIEPLGWIADWSYTPPHPYAGRPLEWIEECLHEHLWSGERQVIESVRDNRYTAVPSSHDQGKCVEVDEEIMLADGRVERAGDLVGRMFAVLAFERDGTQSPALAWGTDNGERDVFEVETVTGRRIVRTGNHPLYAALRSAPCSGKPTVVQPLGWTPVDRLTDGHAVLVPEVVQPRAGRRMPDDDVRFCGYMLGDGGTTRYVGFTQIEGPAKDEFRLLVKGYGCQVRTEEPYGLRVVGPDGERFNRKDSNPVLNRLRDWGLMGTLAREKRFPAWVWELPDDQLAIVLNRLFACDGWASVGRSAAESTVAIALASEGMIRDVERAMLRLGITGTVRARRTTLVDKTFRSWEWACRRTPDVLRFAAVVGIYGKELALDAVVARKLAASAGRKHRWLHDQTPAGYRWDRIRTVRPLGVRPTVTISVPDHHTFVTTFVEHNSFTASRITAHFIETNPDGDAFAITTAPTDPQVKAILWREIGRAHREGKLKGRLTEDAKWKLNMGGGPDELVAYGRKPADTEAVGLFGVHQRKMLIVIDEAGGVAKSIFDAVDGLTTTEDVHVLAIGNPDDPAAHFATICKPGSGWNVIELDGLRSPNFTAAEIAKYPALRQYMIAEGIPPATEQVPDDLRGLLLSPRWVDERIKRWGPTSPMFVSRARGKFPKSSTDTLIEPGWVLAAQQRDGHPELQGARMGVDVARYGPDHTIIVLRRGPVARVVRDIPKGPTTEVAGEVQRVGLEVGYRPIPIANVDDSGVGGGVTDQLIEDGYPVLALNAGGAATELLPNGRPRYPNLRSEWWWNLRQALCGPSGTGADGYLDLDPDDEDLAAQLLAPKYQVNRHGQIVVETKDEMRKRGLPSPDRADALAYSLVVEVDRGRFVPAYSITGDLDQVEW